MSDKPKIVYDIETTGSTLDDIRKDAINNQIGWFLSMCVDESAYLLDVVDVMANIRYLQKVQFTAEEPHLISFKEVQDAPVLLCWCEEICYDPVWAEEDDAENTISDWIVPCFVIAGETFTCSGTGDVGFANEYGKVKKSKDGSLIGQRFWTGGKRPTFEQLKSVKWEGLEEYEYERASLEK